MKKLFDSIQIQKPPRNVFDLSFENKLTCNMGELIPFLTQEVLPGDTFNVKSQILARLQPMLSPVMHRVDVFTHYFFVPNRIIWDEWEKFITGGVDGLQTPTVPNTDIKESTKSSWIKGRLGDYMGIPPVDPATTITQPKTISKLPFLAYAKIWNDYYRDQNLQTELDLPNMTHADITVVRKRAWEKDYFTSALPFAQRGEPVTIPIGDTAPLQQITTSSSATQLLNIDGSTPSNTTVNTAEETGKSYAWNPTDVKYMKIDITPHTEVDLSEATAITVNNLRLAVRLQEFLEKMARSGSRYVEYLLHMFGVKSSDARLQRAEYLGGGKQPIVISEVLQTVEDANAPLGQMGGHGISSGSSNTFNKSFEEHGHIIGIVSIIPRTTYQDGINKKFTRFDQHDYYAPPFAQLGEQEVLQSELYMDWARATATDALFGYQSRFAEYKYNSGQVAGELRDTLDMWHFGRKFQAETPLNEDFIECVPTKDPFAVTEVDEDSIIMQIQNNIKAIRPMPYFNTPTL